MYKILCIIFNVEYMISYREYWRYNQLEYMISYREYWRYNQLEYLMYNICEIIYNIEDIIN